MAKPQWRAMTVNHDRLWTTDMRLGPALRLSGGLGPGLNPGPNFVPAPCSPPLSASGRPASGVPFSPYFSLAWEAGERSDGTEYMERSPP